MSLTFHQEKLQNNLILHQLHLEDGLKREKLGISDQILMQSEKVNEYITSKILKKSLEQEQRSKQEKQYATLESVPITKKKILKGKSAFSKKLTQKQLSLKILDLDSTGTELDLNPFWNKYTKELSNKLWSPTKIECVDLDLNSLNGFSKNLMLNSWFSVKIQENKTCQESYPMICSQLQQSLSQRTMALEQLNTESKEKPQKKILDPMIARKIQLYPTETQKKTLNEWFGIQRWVYNKCLERHLKNKENKKKTTLKDLRENIIHNINFETENTWMKEYEYDLRDEAVRDFMKNITSNLAKGGKFALSFRSLKQQKLTGCSLSVLKKKWNKKKNFYSPIFRPDNLKSHQNLPKNLESDSRLIKVSTNKYFISIPKISEKGDNQAKPNSMIFLDPGVKNFVTGYDPSGKIITWGEHDIGHIARLLHYKNKLQGKIKKELKNKKRKSMRLALLRIGEHIHNLVNDMHKKLAKFLCMNYSQIYLPRLNFHKCKNLNRKSKSKLASLQHCKFLDNLIYKASSYDSKVHEVNEAWTSKTCSNCGYIKFDLKNQDIYNCSNCHIRIGRDINASKNIMLRYFTRAVFEQR